MFKVISREIRKITPEEAGKLLELNNYKSQRNVREVHVKKLARAMGTNVFHTGEVVVAENGTGKKYLMNGQHQCLASIRAKSSFDAVFVTAKCPTSADLALLFAQYDVNATRSITDIVKAETDSMGVEWNWRTGPVLAGAVSVLSGSQGDSKSEKAQRLRKYIREGQFVDQFFSNDTVHIQKIPVVCAMLQTFWKDAADSYKFWSGVAHGEMMAKSDPRLRLRTFLLSATLHGSRTAVSTKDMWAKSIVAWNAWRTGRTTNLKHYANKPIPKAM